MPTHVYRVGIESELASSSPMSQKFRSAVPESDRYVTVVSLGDGGEIHGADAISVRS